MDHSESSGKTILQTNGVKTMKPPINPPFYRVATFNASSWGGWITVKECKTKQRALDCAQSWRDKGYETTIEGVTE